MLFSQMKERGRFMERKLKAHSAGFSFEASRLESTYIQTFNPQIEHVYMQILN
jgi:hypothetical protein